MRPVWAEISLDNLRNNLEIIRKETHNKKVMGIIKADGYGHGAVQIAREMAKNGVDFFGVACMDEAEEIIQNGIEGKILILGCTPVDEWERAIKFDVRLTLCSMEELDYIKAKGIYPTVHIKVDTGMGRIGFRPEEAFKAIKEIRDNRLAKIEGLFTHLSSSDDDMEYTKIQLEKFRKIEEEFPEITFKHVSNSGGVLNINENYNIVRPGIIMYGVVPFEHKDKKMFKPVMQLKSKIVFLKKLEEESYISYSKTYKAKAGSLIATIPAGYADGISRKLSNAGEVEIKGVRCKIIGRVCMDQMMVEIPEGLDVKCGEIVTIFGGDISVEEMSGIAQTIPYEILTCINKRVPRLYINNGKVVEIKSLLGKQNIE